MLSTTFPISISRVTVASRCWNGRPNAAARDPSVTRCCSIDSSRARLRPNISSACRNRVELPFGYPEPMRIDLDDGTLYVRGYVDRVDVEDGRTLVRDLKTGKAHPRTGDEAAPDHRRDVQLALYGMVLRQSAAEHGLPSEICAAYVHMDTHEPERAFRDDFADLEALARGWLAAARRLLASAAFPRTPDPDDCRYCRFAPVCGREPHARALRVLVETEEIAGPFRHVKLGTEAEASPRDEA